MADLLFGSAMMNAVSDLMNQPKATNPNATPRKKKKKQAQQADDGTLAFLQSIMQPQGARRLTMSGQPEKDVPQGLDFFKNTGADRPEVQARKAALDKQSLSNPTAWWQANQAVLDKKRQQGWTDPNTPPAAPTMDMNQFLRTPTKNVDVFTNPAADQVNPRTGLNTNQGSFVRSMPNPYGTARAEFTPQGDVSVGAVQELFGQPQNLTPPSPMYNLPPAPQPAYGPLDLLRSLFGIPEGAGSFKNFQENQQKAPWYPSQDAMM